MVLGMARGFWGQGGGPGHEGGGPGLRKGVLGARRCSWAQMLRTGSSPAPVACGEQELTPLLDKQVLVGR